MASRLSKNFWDYEFTCTCGLPDCDAMPMNSEFIRLIQSVRELAGIPMIVTSGSRCRYHNKIVGGAPDSYHLVGMAGDFRVYAGETRYRLIQAALLAGVTGIGIARTFIHLDNRPKPGLIFLYD